MQMPKSSPDTLELFEAIVPADLDVERRKMFGYPCAFVNGNMFTGVHGDYVILRLGEAERAEFLALPGAHGFEPMPGRPMKEYVVPSDNQLQDRDFLLAWMAKSLAYARSLPPKAKK